MEKISTIISNQRELNPSNMTVDEARTKPKKYSGYPELVKYLASDHSLPIVRRFDRLTLRVMLRLQDEITEIEEQLDAIDKSQMSRDVPEDINNGTFRADPVPERTRLLQNAHEKLERYHCFVHKYSKLRSCVEPRESTIRNFQNWIDNNSRFDIIEDEEGEEEEELVDVPINNEEVQFLTSPDLLPIVPDQRSPFRKFLARSKTFRQAKLWHRDIPDSLVPVPDDGSLLLTDDAKLFIFEKALSGLIGIVMLVLPMWVLAPVDGFYTEIATVTVFVCALTSIVWAATAVRPFESLAVPAGYATFLVLFLLAKKGSA
ncbi:hypothetical protein ASPSYDRAFT_84579 [Aspergillus sydowii CBS 593.65]|uniref:DUF6594 domain-containing protein n=1 Tax=Aspergillus sydowii CBS 593.65 TaxID=1036612 RepID=A0A1L9TYQ8_9EURO|nr:uncharacterized protein ASPSYDRAFT_84579 [Aspergillus sydowii CBS 593.65]OJJ64577.1 hypothetical protein ASPSYDRAFT_84579 [Aspergillus sydowii CBS 593.65]